MKPLQRELTEGDLVARHLVQDRRLAAPVGEQVDEVEHECAHALRRDRAVEVALELIGVGSRRDLAIANGPGRVELLEVRLEKVAPGGGGPVRPWPAPP